MLKKYFSTRTTMVLSVTKNSSWRLYYRYCSFHPYRVVDVVTLKPLQEQLAILEPVRAGKAEEVLPTERFRQPAYGNVNWTVIHFISISINIFIGSRVFMGSHL